MSHVFISYSKQDRNYANDLTAALREKGFDIWLDDHSLHSSEDWWKSIVGALWNCSAIIVILTPASDGSRWVQREIMIADERGKPMFPLLLKGTIDTPNWSIFVRTQYTDVRNGHLPEDDFYDMLANYAPRKEYRGARLVSTDEFPPIQLEDEAFQAAINNPPQKEDASSRKPVQYVLPVGLVLAGLIGLTLVGTRLFNNDLATPTTSPEPIFSPSSPSIVTNEPIPSATPIIATVETFNHWREEHGYDLLVMNDLLNQIAQQHISDLASRPLSELGNMSRSSDGRDIQQLAEEAGYGGQAQMVVFVTEGEVTLDDLLLRLESFGDADIQQRYHEIGFATERRIATNRLYFVLVLGQAN